MWGAVRRLARRLVVDASPVTDGPTAETLLVVAIEGPGAEAGSQRIAMKHHSQTNRFIFIHK